MVQNGLKWSKLVKMVKIAKNDPKCQNGLNWSEIVKKGQKWRA